MTYLSIVTPCYNEEQNVCELFEKVKEQMKKTNYQYEHIFIDNASTDKTVEVLKKLMQENKEIKLIVNSRNFGHIRSPFYGLLQAKGDAVIFIVADLQDPPSLITEFIKRWEDGAKIVIGVKPSSEENQGIFLLRKLYYKIANKISEIDLIQNFLGFGLYDKVVISALRQFNDPYPYFRGMVAEVGFERIEIPYRQKKRKKGKTKNNFYSLYDMAMLGITSYSKILMRMATFLGFGSALISLCLSLLFLIFKLIAWKTYSVGQASLLVGLFFFCSIQLFFFGIMGEYIMQILAQTKNRPLVIEKERVGFEK